MLGLQRVESYWGTGFPFEVPAVAASEDLRLDTPVTLLAGDNGSGKSTLVEAIAEAMGFAAEGGELERSGELPAVPRPVMGGGLVPVLSRTRPRNGYFLRAESFFNVARFVDSDDVFAPDLSLYGEVPLHKQSHGQSFLALAANRFAGEGLYVLDEPEAALSPTGALALLAVVAGAARRRAVRHRDPLADPARVSRRAPLHARRRRSRGMRLRRPRGRPRHTGLPPGARALRPRRARGARRLTRLPGRSRACASTPTYPPAGEPRS